MRNFRLVREDNDWTGVDDGHGDKMGQCTVLYDGDTPIAEFSAFISDEDMQKIVDTLNGVAPNV